MNINFSTSSITTMVKHNLRFILYSCFVVLTVWLLFFAYQNLYSSIISPGEIDKSEIIAKRQKVNIKLFSAITANISDKTKKGTNEIGILSDPFD